MTTITYQYKADPVYDEYGYIIGYDTLKDITVNIADEAKEDYLNRLISEDAVSNIKVYTT